MGGLKHKTAKPLLLGKVFPPESEKAKKRAEESEHGAPMVRGGQQKRLLYEGKKVISQQTKNYGGGEKI